MKEKRTKAKPKSRCKKKTPCTQFFKNLEYFRTNFGLTVDEFCQKGNLPGWIPVGKTSYGNYKSGAYPGTAYLIKITDALNLIIEQEEILRKRFPKGILPTELLNEDLAALVRKEGFYAHEFHSDKMQGSYICYYESTNVEGAKKRQYGVLQLVRGDSKTEFSAYGVFSLNDFEQALQLYKATIKGVSLKSKAAELKNTALFKGTGYLTYAFLWIHLMTEMKDEFVSLSFDLSEKVLTKNPLRPFSGALGSAHSQTSGISLQTTHFPIILVKKPVFIEDDVLREHLHFSYDIDSNALHEAASKTILLLENITGGAFSKETQTELLVTMMNNQLQLLVRDMHKSLYFSRTQRTNSYKEIFSSIRNEESTEI